MNVDHLTCLRCGQALPEGSSQSRRYCDVCAAERNRELTRKRQRKAVKRMQEVNAERFYNADREYIANRVSIAALANTVLTFATTSEIPGIGAVASTALDAQNGY